MKKPRHALFVPRRPARGPQIGTSNMNFRKKKLQRILGLLALSTLIVTSATVQARGPGRDCHQKLLSQLEFTPEQQSSIDEIRDGAREQRKEIFDNEALSREEKREAIHTLRASTRSQIQSILSDEQRAQFEALIEARIQARLEKRIERLTEKLELSQTQADAIRDIFEAAHPKIKAIKDSDATHEEKGQQIRAIKDEVRSNITLQLDEAQAETFAEMAKKREGRAKRRRNRRG